MGIVPNMKSRTNTCLKNASLLLQYPSEHGSLMGTEMWYKAVWISLILIIFASQTTYSTSEYSTKGPRSIINMT